MAETELEKAEKKLSQAKARVQSIKARQTTAERKKDTRRKIILGGGLLERAKRGDAAAAQLFREIVGGLDRPVDQKAFENFTIEGNEK
jgi:hypothetical protein